jgi:hypothetical protein
MSYDGREVRPWDFLKPNTEYAPKDVQDFRYEICKSCTLFNTAIKTCTACGCFMQLKTKLAHASCPIEKWGVHENNLGDKQQ